MQEVNRVFIPQKNTVEGSEARGNDNPFNLIFVETAEDVGRLAKQEIGNMPYRIATAGYSAPPEGYEQSTKQFLKALDLELGVRSTAFVTSPTADKGSIDAITTEISGLNNGKIFYTTSQNYTKYINPNNFPPTIDSVKYSQIPKYVLPNNSEYSKATAEASNIFVSTGGRNTTVSDFVNALKKGNKAIILNNSLISTPAWGEAKSRVENASKYLKEQIDAFNSGKELPYPEVEGFTKDFMNAHRRELNNLVKVINIDSLNPQANSKAAKSAAQFIKY